MQTPSKKTVLELKAFNLKTFISASGEPTNVLNFLHGLGPTYKDWVHRHIEINKIIPETETDINQVVTLRSTIQAAINEERTRRSALLQDGDDNHQALVATTRGLNAKEKWYCAGCDRMGYHHETECVIKHPHLKVAHEKRMEQKRLRVAEFHQRQADRRPSSGANLSRAKCDLDTNALDTTLPPSTGSGNVAYNINHWPLYAMELDSDWNFGAT